jgi:hypothetical protein
MRSCLLSVLVLLGGCADAPMNPCWILIDNNGGICAANEELGSATVAYFDEDEYQDTDTMDYYVLDGVRTCPDNSSFCDKGDKVAPHLHLGREKEGWMICEWEGEVTLVGVYVDDYTLAGKGSLQCIRVPLQ